MKVWKKSITMLLVATMAVASLAGCSKSNGNDKEVTPTKAEGQTSNTNNGNSETATGTGSENPMRPEKLDKIKVVLFGEESPRMSELMENEFKQLFIDEINTEVELMYVPWSEYGPGGKIDLMIASGQEFDCTLVDPNWVSSSVSKGYLQDLSSVIETNLPDWKKVMNEVSLQPYTYGEKIYAIPIGNKPKADEFRTVCVRQDLMAELGVSSIASLEELTAYAKAVKAKYPEMYATYEYNIPDYILRGASDKNLTTFATGLFIDQDTKQLVSAVDSEAFKAIVDIYNEWYKADLLPKDILTTTTSTTQAFMSGMTAFMRGSCGTTVIENEPNLKKVIPTASTKEYYLKPEKNKYKSSYENTAIQVPVHSKKADRVALFANLLQKNTEIADMMIYGVEGTDYTIENNKLVAKNTDELFYQWMIFNVNLNHFDERFPDDFIDTYKNWDNDAITDITFGLSLDYENIKTQKAQIDTVWSEVALPMLAGIKDYDSGIEQLRSELKKAGWDEYVAEIQKQLNEHLSK